MNKVIFMLMLFLFPVGVSAQEFLKIEDIEYDYVCSKSGFHISCRYDRRLLRSVLLSNGKYLYREGHESCDGFYWCENHCNRIKTNVMNLNANFSKDKTFIYHVGKTYWVETINHKKTHTIKKVTVREVSRENEAELNGDFSYNGFLALWRGIGGGIGKAKGKVSGSMRGGKKTVVNVFFEDGGYASINASDDPIWLEAESGMKVELYKLRDTKIYKLIL